MSQNDINRPFTAVGQRFGFNRVDAEFHPFKEFKTTWQRCGTSAEFKVTDYLKTADPEILEEFARCLFTRIQQRIGEVYTEPIRQYLQSKYFIEQNQSTYLRRSRNLLCSPRGAHYDLREILESLRSQGLVEDCHSAFMSWTDRPNRFRMGYCSILMQVVAISSILDSPDIPKYVAEYVLYHEMLHLEKGLDSLRSQHNAEFRRMERKYPRFREAEDWLKRIARETR
ncbi:MAG: DUF45 domain-containing protein [Methanomassiliicoccales archaeon]|nr:DUF45 domain-containing protein [Methanomassiliicoccales archaeon]